MYDGLRRIPIHKARDIGKQYPPCAVVTRYISPLCRPLSPPFFYPLLAPFLSVLSLRPLRPTSSTFRWERAQAPQRQVAGEQTRGRFAKLRAIYGGFSRSCPLCARVCRFQSVLHDFGTSITLVSHRFPRRTEIVRRTNSRMDLARTRGNSCRVAACRRTR